MNYKEKYEQALERAKKYHQQLLDEDNHEWASEIEELFPELAESGDEKVRKELIDAIQGLWDNDALPMPLSAKRKNEWIAWLEKQGQPKPSMQNGIIINGVEYELIADKEADECERCALKELCKSQEEGEVLCIYLFTESVATNHRFEKR